ncbi:MAG: prepilin-type N-terminal cleavage/methylation domain-containing protein, partial [Planctomycetota bacterium]
MAWANLFAHGAPGDAFRSHGQAELGHATRAVSRASRLTPRAPRLGFTLVEIVVVISIVLFLVGLTLSVSTVVIERSEIRQTENTMRLLDTALQEWEALADRQVTWGTDGIPDLPASYDLKGNWMDGRSDTDDVFVIS